MIVPQEYFIWFVTALVFCTSAAWLVVDTRRLARALTDQAGNKHDRIFGSIIGLVVALIGVAGAIKYHLG